MRDLMAYPAALVLKVTGFRFSKAWRQEEGTWRAWVWTNLLNTTKANQLAGV